eukprot:TRINITY_DN18481_c0_g1_i1.p1 TRINITY_DN18481_c0_g1~~TRINITY_DN18481_c0_g1_i1.p1  ORF type:complete len:185 (-),score=39.61 TRINITY_DN18481_c0_g1_i1:147-647(-)
MSVEKSGGSVWTVWIKRFGWIGGVGLLIFILGFLIALKLRLLSKFGIYLGGIGLCFLTAGVVLLFNTGLLIIGNLFILAGLVFIVGFERTKTFWDIFQKNRCCGRGLARAGFVIFLSGMLAGILDKLPVIHRVYRWVPFISRVVDAKTDQQLIALSDCVYHHEKTE